MDDHYCKRMKKRRTAVTDLSLDEVSLLFIIVTQSGAAELARLMAVCRLFSEVGKSKDVLRAMNFDDFDVSIDDIKNYQQINGLIRLSNRSWTFSCSVCVCQDYNDVL